MSTETVISISSVFDYIRSEYGQDILNKVNNNNNLSTVNKIFDVSVRQGQDVPNTANKIIAMLRVNPR